MKRNAGALLVIVLALGLVAPGGEARAAENDEFSLRPVRPANASARERSYVVRTVAPGQGFDDRLEALNLGDAPLDLVVEPVDAEVTPDGSFAPGLTRAGEGAWLRVTPGRVRVPAHGSAQVALRVDVPADAAPGDHIAAVVVRKAEAGSAKAGGVQLVQRVGVRVYLTVAGSRTGVAPKRAFELRGFRWVGSPDRRTFEADVANVGDLLVEPLGTLTLERGDFTTNDDLPPLGIVLPGTVATLRVHADGRLDPGDYQATLRLRLVQGGDEQEKRVSFTVSGTSRVGEDRGDSLPLLPVVLAVGALLSVGVLALRRRMMG